MGLRRHIALSLATDAESIACNDRPALVGNLQWRPSLWNTGPEMERRLTVARRTHILPFHARKGEFIDVSVSFTKTSCEQSFVSLPTFRLSRNTLMGRRPPPAIMDMQ